MTRVGTAFRSILDSPLLVVGSLLLVMGTGPLVVWLMVDPSANPVLPGIFAGCTFPFAALLTIGGLADLVLRVIPARRREVEQQRREQQGLCRHCGYDLRGSEDRCPECGTRF